MQYTLEQVIQLSPDDASAKAAKGLLAPAKWPTLGINDVALWGECQGSGSKPYQVQFDPAGTAFKCSCPSRKFPCKHGLALLMLWVQHQDKFSRTDLPAWVQEWINSRQERAEKQAAKKAEPPKAVDPAAAAKREAARDEKMLAGLDELERWLHDQIRQGISSLPNQSQVWRTLASRMVDAQLPGLANRLQDMDSKLITADWPEKLLAELGQIQLIIDGYRRLATLPAPLQADLRAVLGVNVDKDWVLQQGEKLAGNWWVVGQIISQEERLWSRRVWLRHIDSGRYALLLDYSHGAPNFETSFVTRLTLLATLAYYPGSANLRALLVEPPKSSTLHALPQHTFEQAFNELTQQHTRNPWAPSQPLLISGYLQKQAQSWLLQDEAGFAIALRISDEQAWSWLAQYGGQKMTVFGEWAEEKLLPLSDWAM